MIFLGDIACPDTRIDEFIDTTNSFELFRDQIVVANLEGCIVDDELKRNNHSLYNVSGIVSAFKDSEKVIYSLANNHMYDYPHEILQTKRILEDKGIGTFGLYEEDGSVKPYEYTDKSGVKYAFFGHCWRLYTHTNRNTVNGIRVVDCDYEEFCTVVGNYIERHKETKVCCFMHWNYDMEILPFPMLREVSRRLIEIGVEAVIGNHSHVPQGAEIYNGKLIAYCLGNFYLPSGFFFSGKLTYPEEAMKAYIVRLDTASGEHSFRWFRTDCGCADGAIVFDEKSEDGLLLIKKISPFIGMDDKKYRKYFRVHRRKKLLVPAYNKYKGITHELEEWLGILRINIIKKIQR